MTFLEFFIPFLLGIFLSIGIEVCMKDEDSLKDRRSLRLFGKSLLFISIIGISAWFSVVVVKTLERPMVNLRERVEALEKYNAGFTPPDTVVVLVPEPAPCDTTFFIE